MPIAQSIFAAGRGNAWTPPPSSGGAEITWNAVAGATSYRIYWGLVSGVYIDMVDVGDVTSYAIDDLDFESGVSYFVIVRAFSTAAGESDASAEIEILDGVEQ